MRKAQLSIKGKAGIIGMMCLVAALFSSCLKNHDEEYVAPSTANVWAINASPGSQPVDFYVDQNRAYSNIPYGSGLPDYLQVYTGKRTATFYASGTQQVIKSDTMTLKKDQYYSLFLTNLPSQAEFLLIRDSIARPATGKATIRLLNLSPNAGAVDLVIKDGALLAFNKGFKGYSPFVPVNGNASYTLEIRQTGTSNVLASLSNVQLNSDALYTIWLQGVTGATDQTKLTAKLQSNGHY
ncbi:DUF4397 domain-containing protein [Mucilaginibacter lacusdianchii]|uniref:DUF4397 domain-containing protein n=1 Tax=Mucilaginibacter lacusdianchii TaxID=2684211 RepID=UPI00131BC703|nr:DUF4397 domain-containing protein [Mucilaginibacter sp. JXJ CY 39]